MRISFKAITILCLIIGIVALVFALVFYFQHITWLAILMGVLGCLPLGIAIGINIKKDKKH